VKLFSDYADKMVNLKEITVTSVCVAFVFSLQALSQNAPVTGIPSIGNLLPGQEVTVPVIVTGFNNIGSVSLTCDFDTNSFQFVSFEVNSSLIASGTSDVGDNNTGDGTHRLIFGWFGNSVTLPDSSWIIRYVLKYRKGDGSLRWFDNGPSCAYTDPKGAFMNDLPTSEYYFDGHLCEKLYAPELISGPDSVGPGAENIIYTIDSLENVISYNWSVPFGAKIVGGADSTSITVNFMPAAISGNISVSGISRCGEGPSAFLPVTITGQTTSSGNGLGQGSLQTGSGFLIYPNPADDWFIIKTSKQVYDWLTLEILASNGEVARIVNIKNQIQYKEFPVDISDIKPGIYFVVIRTRLGNIVNKLIIK